MKKAQSVKCRARRTLLFFVLLSAFSLQLLAFLTGCAHLKEYAQTRRRLSFTALNNLKGLSKVEVVKLFGSPLATSKSEVSECWYYARPREIWIWFKENRVDHWEVK